MNQTAMTKAEELIVNLREDRERKREECKKAVTALIELVNAITEERAYYKNECEHKIHGA